MAGAEDRLFSGRLRALQYASDGCVLFAFIVFALVVGENWSWGPFILAPLIAVTGLVANELILRVARRMLRPNAEQLRRAVERKRRRNTVVIPAYATMGIGCGAIAGSIPSYLPDVIFGLMMLLVGVVLPLALLPRIRGRAEMLRSAEAGNP